MTLAVPDVSFVLNVSLLLMLLAIAVAIAVTRSLLAAILLLSVYSFIGAAWLMVMDAADVAFTEAVVGAGVSTLVLLGAILLTQGEMSQTDWKQQIGPLVLVLAVGGLLIYAATGLPGFGDPASPANSYVGRMYLQTTYNDIGAPNVVTAVLASYRGFDTLGETTVIFAACIGVALMLDPGSPGAAAPASDIRPGQHIVLRVISKLLIPLIILFAFYVQFHGDLGAGGGFQAGVTLAVAVILHALIFGLEETTRAFPPHLMRAISSGGVMVYSAVGVVCILNGGSFLDYDFLFTPQLEAAIPPGLLGDPDSKHHWGQHFGILLIELGVLLTVSSTMVSIFFGFAGRAPRAASVGQGE
jgi:multicomponent Na+:H+ antiporter subunit B